MTGLFLAVTCGRFACAPLFIGNPGFGRGGGSGGAGFLTACRPVRNPYGIGTGAWEGREGLSAGCWLDLLELGEQFQGHSLLE